METVLGAKRQDRESGETSGQDRGRPAPAKQPDDECDDCGPDEIEVVVSTEGPGSLDRLHRVARGPSDDAREPILGTDQLSGRAESPRALLEVDGVPRPPDHGSRHTGHQEGGEPSSPMDEDGDRDDHGCRDEGGHLGSDEDSRAHACQCQICARPAKDEEDRRRDERRHDDVVERGGSLHRDDGEGREDERAERRAAPVESDAGRDSVDGEHRHPQRGHLDEARPPQRSRQQYRHSLHDFRVRREVVDPRVRHPGNRADRALLDPEHCAREVVGEDVVFGRWREERERQEVSDLGEYQRAQDCHHGIAEQVPHDRSPPE